MRGLLSALLVLLVGTSGCLSSCQVIGGGIDSVLADPVDDVLTLPVDEDDAVVGIDWPFEPTIILEFGKETTFAHLDAIETPTNFGSQTEVVVTQGTLASRPQFQSPCAVGPAIACAYFDGGDFWLDAILRASLKYLHDGTGATCYLVFEPSSTSPAPSRIMSTAAAYNAGENSFIINFTSSTTDRLGHFVANSAAFIVSNIPGAGTGLQDQTWGSVFTHGTARTNDFFVESRGVTLTANVDYTGVPNTGNPAGRLQLGATTSGTGALIGWWFALACDAAIHDATMISDTWAAIEARTGVLPQ